MSLMEVVGVIPMQDRPVPAVRAVCVVVIVVRIVAHGSCPFLSGLLAGVGKRVQDEAGDVLVSQGIVDVLAGSALLDEVFGLEHA